MQLSNILYNIVTFLTITIPSWVYSLISISLTVTVNFSTLAFVAVACLSAVSYFIRYRYQVYSTVPVDLPRKEPDVDVFPDLRAESSKPAFSNYLDEFLSAIKVFGYLERPVFHELTRTMHTRKLIAGETFLLEEEKGFCLVVEGSVQIFVKSQRDRNENAGEGEEPENDHQQGYQLLTEVENGSPMSSLFSILALFTEDITLKPSTPFKDGRMQLAHPVPSHLTPLRVDPGDIPPSFPGTPLDGVNGSGSPERDSIHFVRRRSSVESSGRPGHSPGHLNSVPPLHLEDSIQADGRSSRPHNRNRRGSKRTRSAHPNIVARASVDSTIAIIPATAFRRLTRLYPKATAHIIQVILTRFYRVTLATGHRYLGLTHELMHTEKSLNKFITSELPDFLRGSALDSLKERFALEKERISPEEGLKGIALHNPGSTKRTSARSSIRRQFQESSLHSPTGRGSERASSPENTRTRVSAGDLLGHVSKGRFNFTQPLQTPAVNRYLSVSPLEKPYSPPYPMKIDRPDSKDEGYLFREATLEAMCKAMGLTHPSAGPVGDPIEQSPRLVSYDSRRQKAVFNNMFGFIDPYEASVDGDSESQTSTSMFSTNTSHNLLRDLVDDVEIVYFQRGSVLVEEQERLPGLYYLIDGFLDIGITLEDDVTEINILGTADKMHERRSSSGSSKKPEFSGHRQSIALVKPGSLAGYLPTISGFRSFVDIRAKSDVVVGFLPHASLERLSEKYPIVLLTLAKRLTSILDRMILHIDFALEYLQVTAGQCIYQQDDQSDSIFIVLNGRLRAIKEHDDKSIAVLGEYGQGESVGELEVLTEACRPGSLHAIRDTELAKLPKTLFNSLAQEHPVITMKISKILAKRMRTLMDSVAVGQERESRAIGGNKNPSSTVNLRTVGILPNRAGVPVAEFATRLVGALTEIGISVVSLTQSAILNHLGRHAFTRMGKLKLSQYLADLEEKYGLVLFVADTTVQSPWTATCISQSDCILVVGLATDVSSLGEYERFLMTAKITARKELVLLHPERLCPPGLTRRWLRNRVWINGGHHHIQMDYRSSSASGSSADGDPSARGLYSYRRFGMLLRQRVQTLQAEIQKYASGRRGEQPSQSALYSSETPFKGDFHRLARRLCGKSVGLVLGGGGARGIAHVGVIRAMEEAGIPIDMVGGTSIGAFVGALYAWDVGVVPMYGRIKRFAGRMGSMWRFALDLTYPSASYTTGHEFNRGIFKTFGDYLIEDFWLPYYCNTTNISKSRPEYHTSGYVWRYVRASMSLAGLVPPLCDDGSLLLDGGYIDNLTVAHMKSLGADVIFAVDVGSLDDTTPQTFGDHLSGFWALWNRINPFSNYPNPPSLGEIQSRLAYVSSVDALERAKTMPGCFYMRPAIDPWGTLQFGEFDKIYRTGYRYGQQFLQELRERDDLPVQVGGVGVGREEGREWGRTRMVRRASI